MLLTCPTCRSGLQVPDGTTAHVRCPSCRTIFAPAADTPAPVATPKPPPRPTAPTVRNEPAATPAVPRRRERVRDEEERPRRRERERDEEEPRPRRRERADGLSQEERAARRAAFQRAAWGCKLLALSLALYALSMLLISVYFIRAAIASDTDPAFITGAGALGLINWIVGAVGVGLCLSGYVSAGHWRFGITAAVMVVVHGIFLAAVVNRGEAAAEFLRGSATTSSGAGMLAQLPTKLDALTLYLAWWVYPDQMNAPGSVIVLSMLTGVAEMVRLACIMLFLSCLARAAGDDELVHRCVRAAGLVCIVPGLMALAMLVIGGFMIETSAQGSTGGAVVGHMVVMGVYAVFAGMILKPLMATRDTADASDAPFESEKVVFGG